LRKKYIVAFVDLDMTLSFKKYRSLLTMIRCMRNDPNLEDWVAERFLVVVKKKKKCFGVVVSLWRPLVFLWRPDFW